MACTTETKTIVLEAATVSWGKEDKNCITPAAGLAGGEYFEMSSQDTEYYVWTDIADGSVDPAPAGKTAVEVDVGVGYTAAEWIVAFSLAIELTGEFLASTSSDGLSVSSETIKVGAPLSALADVDTAFTFESIQGGVGGELGKTKEGIEVSYEATLFDVKSNQTGELLLDQIIQGTNASASMSLLEVTKERLAFIFGEGFGDKYTPAGGSEVVGFGSSKNFTSSFDTAGKLILHPVRLAASDRSEDVSFHKTIPMPESINYDGTDTKALSVSFTALVDESKDESISIFAIGDWNQDLRS